MRALKKLDGQKIGYNHCSIRYAKTANYDELGEKPKPRLEIPALAAGSSQDGKPVSVSNCSGSSGNRKKDMAIQAIEAKLRTLEHRRVGEEFQVNTRTVASYQEAPIQNYQFNLNGTVPEKKYSTTQKRGRHHHNRPYSRPNNRK